MRDFEQSQTICLANVDEVVNLDVNSEFNAFFDVRILTVYSPEDCRIRISDGRLFTSDGNETTRNSDGVMAVVRLKSDVKFSKKGYNSWDLTIR